MIGQTISHYRILEHLGAGGMGTVYKAEDTRLHRPVALKLLPEDATVSPGDRKRLAREAESAAQLSHPNIATVYDFDEFNDTTTKTRRAFIAMEYVEGESLKKKIAEQLLPFEEITSILVQVARALQAAHERGIVHRDVKPANIILTPGGTAKLLDFGIAKRAGETRVTGKGEVSGSVAYMSPEQLRDEHTEARTDIWALGVVAFEMLTQKKPFRGEHPAALMYSITNEEPLDLASLRPRVPEPLRALCRRCLQKDPQNRPRSMDEILTLLKAGPAPYTGSAPESPLRSRRWKRAVLMGGTLVLLAAIPLLFPSLPKSFLTWVGILGPPEGVRIAVLRFEGRSIDSTLCDGLAETIVRGVRQLLRHEKESYVFSLTDIYDPRYQISSVGDVRKMFRATHVISGTVQRGDRRLILTFINAADGQQLAAIPIPYLQLSDPGLQGQILSTLGTMLHRAVHADVRRDFERGSSSDTNATRLYREGLGFMQLNDTTENMLAAIMKFGIAIARDSTFALAHAALGSAYLLRYKSHKEPHMLDLAQRSCQRAIALAERLPDPYVTLGSIHLLKGEEQAAQDELNRALALDSTNADAFIAVARTYVTLGIASEAERWFRDAIRVRPDSWLGYNALGRFYFDSKRYRDAVDQFRLAAELTPDNYRLYSNIGSAYLRMDSIAQAMAMYERSVDLKPDDANLSNLATYYWRMGKYSEAVKFYGRALQIKSTDYRIWGNLAAAHQMIPGSGLEMHNAARRAVEYAEQKRALNPRDPEVMADLASYYAMIGQKETALPLLKTARARGSGSPDVLASIAQTYEELGERDRALEVLGEAFLYGYDPSDFEQLPRMRSVLQDPRYKRAKDRIRSARTSIP